MLIISALDKIFEPSKKYVFHKNHGQISINKFKFLFIFEAPKSLHYVQVFLFWVNMLCQPKITLQKPSKCSSEYNVFYSLRKSCLEPKL